MRILFIAPYLPSLIRVRPYNLLHALVERGHQVTLLALQPPGDDAAALPQLQAWCERVVLVPHSRARTLLNGVLALPQSLPIQAAYSRSSVFRRELGTILNQTRFDVVHVEHLRGAVLAEGIRDVPVIYDSVDSITLLFEKVLRDAPTLKSRFIAQLDLARTRRFEGQLTQRFSEVVVTSAADRQALIDYGSAADHVTVVPNGVDLDYFQPQPDAQRDERVLVFTGKMSYHANIAAVQDLVQHVMPLVWAGRPDAHLKIVGKDPAPVIQMLGEHPNITVTGAVPDMRPYLAEASAAISIVRYGVGIQNKVLEAMAMATPVVCSAQACSALHVEPGRELLVGDTPAAIAAQILHLLDNPVQRTAIGQAGRAYVMTQQTWGEAARILEDVYQRARA